MKTTVDVEFYAERDDNGQVLDRDVIVRGDLIDYADAVKVFGRDFLDWLEDEDGYDWAVRQPDEKRLDGFEYN